MYGCVRVLREWEEKRGVGELQKFGSLSHPSLELSTTAPLVRDWEGSVSFCLNLFPPFTQDPSLCTSLIGDLLTALLSRLPLGARGIYQEDNDQKFSSQSFYITDIISFFLQTQTQWSTSYISSGCPFAVLVIEDEEASVITAMCPPRRPVRRTPP
ncbi:hypothetical protein PFLUV_G00141610 [Perca fluviatilis]|uniref:Uncharacterized protein n=1 Tax=Perca fluviatilis TaxID=8168 RepID=A0A6A5EIK9_PERFL|nr:hypothetical protein PFLUV_G00141610 [Perca fluviatilis]